MFKAIVLVSCFLGAWSQSARRGFNADNDPLSEPTPYQYSYEAPAIGGYSRKSETADADGRVEGSYEVGDEDGRSRIVRYIADEDGFRASISTNEPGTSNQSPADVTILSSAEEFRQPAAPFRAAPIPAAPILAAPIPAAPRRILVRNFNPVANFNPGSAVLIPTFALVGQPQQNAFILRPIF